MNSYMRQSSVSADQMHSFLKDKQAWENAIALYQGPDPLDHWWNYICWYENHGHGDPDNKFRETLERCLTLYEHSDYYKQDLRMVRLWLKYIDMQNNPLHFYQVLHQRGVGKQAACFYIGWATYYESINSFKEAEAVYNLAFQEKAQPYADLHHAHSKLMYTKSVHAQQLLQQQQHPAYVHQNPPTNAPAHHVQQQGQQHTVQQYRQQVSYHQTSTAPNQTVASQQPVAHPQQTQTSGQQQTHQVYHQQQVHTHYTAGVQQQVHVQGNPQQVHLQGNPHQQHVQVQGNQQQQQHPVHVQHHQQQPPHTMSTTVHQTQLQTVNATQVPQHAYNVHPATNHQATQNQRTVPVEQQLPAVTTNMTRQQYERALEASTKHQTATTAVEAQSTATVNTPSIQVPGLKTNRKFPAYCRNNHETWQPALFLEEPDDPQKICYYTKSTVYPQGQGVEYSPEEIRARRYKQKMLELKQKQQQSVAEVQQKNQTQQLQSNSQQNHAQVQEIGSLKKEPVHHQQQQQQTTQHYYVQQQQQVQHSNIYYHQSQQIQQQQNHQQVNQIHHKPQQMVTNYQPGYHQPQQQQQQQPQQYTKTSEEGYEEEEEADDDAGADTEDQDDDNPDTEEEEQQQQYQQRQQFYHQPQQVHYQHNAVNTQDDLEDQIEASTIRFSMHTPSQGSQNKTLKIKFKKERPTTGTETPNGNNNSYSAYTIERIYHQPEIDSPTMPENALKRNNGNNHSFHPYLLGQTSTPKTSAKRQKSSKLKKVSNKFHVLACHNSNSSSAENGHINALNASNNNNSLSKIPSDNNNKSHLNATFNDNANYSFSSAAALDNSNCSLSNAVGRLNFRDASALNNTTLNQSNAVDISTYQENSYFSTQHDIEAKERRLAKALETIERHMAKEAIDPFSSELCKAFLTKLDFPGTESEAHENYKIIQTPLPKIANTRQLTLGDGIQFNIDKEIGRGSYGSVYKATDAVTGAVVALKFQKPANTWEIYICDQVLKRIKSPNILPGLMDISTAIIAPNASIIATEFSPFGSLLDINNKIRQATTKVMHESLVMHFSAQICNIISHLHQNKIIHADIKPDNFLLMRVPSTDLHFPSLRLIDFGCAIDMTLFPDGDKTKFRKVIQTDGFTCIEMQEGRSWSYETDLFCIAGTVHVMLFGEYMQLQKRGDTWDIKQKLPRYLKKHVWTQFFGDILNIKSNKLPNLSEMRNIFEEEAARMDSELQKQMRTLSNILHRR
ncbi:putative mediator of RNA polymerase II transcription subunit 26 [Musca vetustissima]|uniref:putative mediator of RNA polymerase II transcription subunit 26 n=1 Tax=Musca vetustissima TaxID=27455 RepID=UPI002AB5E38C|nr:putative mediator of RNA polymerase II transcription subunit 26 [Musca vetustissima]